MEFSDRSREEICADIEGLIKEPGYIFSLVTMLYHDLFVDPNEAADINWHERLSFQEFTFIAGLLVKYPLNLTQPDQETLARQIKQTYKLFEELHWEHNSHWVDKLASKLPPKNPSEADFRTATREIFGDGKMMTEPIFYGGSGAYDFQYWELAPKKYQYDQKWLRDNNSLNIETAAKIIEKIKKAKGAKPKTLPKSITELNNLILDIFCISEAELKEFSRDDIKAVFANFSVEFGEANKNLRLPGQYNQLSSHPLIKLDDTRYFLPVHFNLSQSLYESPFYWMQQDKSYGDKALEHRGTTTELITEEYLASVFGKSRVYRNVKIYSGKHVLNEIDVLVILGNKALVVQCKSKRLTELSRTGDTASLENDFKKAVQQAYEQGLGCRENVLNPNGLTFKADGKEIKVPDIDEAYIACVVSDHYPALTHQAHIYLDKKEDDPYPIAMSVFDLDIMAFYLRNAFEFMYYIRQRIDTADYFSAGEEIALLAYHLRKKLIRNSEADRIAIDDSMAQLIDANFPSAKHQMPETDAAKRLFHEWKNEDFEQLIADIQATNIPKFVDATFLLYDMAGDSANRLIDGIKMIKARSQSDKQRHSLAIHSDEGDAGISYLVLNDSPNKLTNAALIFGEAKKYRTKYTNWLALGGVALSPKLVDFFAYKHGQWEEDERLEELSKVALKTGTELSAKPKIGRNEPCYCGSGLKFKKCHGKLW